MLSRSFGYSGSALALGIVFVVLAWVPGGAVGATVTGATADGSTSINSSTCSTSLSATIPQTLNVANNDTVQTIYNVAWSDTRRVNSSSVSSAFTVKVWYPSDASSYTSDSHTEVTTGSASGSTVLTTNTAGVTEGTTMKVQFDVQVSGGGIGCGELQWRSGTITFT